MAMINQQAPATGQQLAEGERVINMADKAEEYLGGKGMTVIADTVLTPAPANQCFIAIQMLSDSVIEEINYHASAPISGDLTGITLGTNVVIYGKFMSIKLTSGSVIAYRGVLQ